MGIDQGFELADAASERGQTVAVGTVCRRIAEAGLQGMRDFLGGPQADDAAVALERVQRAQELLARGGAKSRGARGEFAELGPDHAEQFIAFRIEVVEQLTPSGG